jgi:hypothetical protein
MPKVVSSVGIAGFFISAAIAKISSETAGLVSLICLLPVLFVLNVAVIRFVRRYCYRPPENHLAVLYRLGRFHRLVTPEEWVFLLPYLDRVHREVSLYMRTAELQLKRVELVNGLAVDVWLKVFFRVDLRLVHPENFIQVMKFEGMEWAAMVNTSTEDVIRNQVFLDSTYSEIIDQRKSREIKQRLSREIAGRLRSFGIVINESHGVMPINIQPNSAYFKAVQASRAATPIGEAALERLRPILGALSQIKHEDARTALLLQLASKIAEVDDLPDIVISPSDSYSPGGSREAKTLIQSGPSDGLSRKLKPQDRKYPLAG